MATSKTTSTPVSNTLAPVLHIQPKYKTYLSNKGYVIYKNSLNEKEQTQLETDLTIIPFNGLNYGKDNDTDKYYAYMKLMDSSSKAISKYVIPYYYGVKFFGEPNESKLVESANINVEFKGELRENQKPVIDLFLSTTLGMPDKKKSGGLLELYTAFGKTTLSLFLISQLKKKTLVIVHKEFLMNQWIERIGQYLPNAKVGKIQGEIIDIDGKDIVLGMLQSISMKDYPASIFQSFGFLIVDETHHISSEVFSKSLFKIVTKYTLGLSATMSRKDKTEWVFKSFLGDILYTAKKRDEDLGVVVRALEYYIDDDEFNDVPYDYKGNPQYSVLISRLCASNHRTEFILRVLADMIAENSKQQIMILAHNRNIIEYMYDAINHRQIGSVGKYLGGMKEKELKISETKQIILGTYQMAQEGLDIKTLTTIFLASPKCDIVQSVGRILRDKNETSPVIVDFIDYHSIFQNQWKKRGAYYKKEQYKIIQTKNVTYSSDTNKWKIIHHPKLDKKLDKSYSKKSSAVDNNDDDDDNDNKKSVCLL